MAENTVQQWMWDAVQQIGNEALVMDEYKDEDDVTYATEYSHFDSDKAVAILAAHAPQAAPVPEGITPLPWKLSGPHTDCGLSAYRLLAFEGERLREVIADLMGDGETMPKFRANAAYIVQACNAYPKLLSALREATEALEQVIPYMEAAEKTGLVGDEGCHWPVEIVRAAIASAYAVTR